MAFQAVCAQQSLDTLQSIVPPLRSGYVSDAIAAGSSVPFKIASYFCLSVPRLASAGCHRTTGLLHLPNLIKDACPRRQSKQMDRDKSDSKHFVDRVKGDRDQCQVLHIEVFCPATRAVSNTSAPVS